MSAAPMPPRAARPEGVRVWDPLVRAGHWVLAAAVLGAFFLEDDLQAWHERLGYLALAVVAIRLAWGFVGTRHARFRDFVRPLGEVGRYARSLLAGHERRYVGHNPLGGLWIVVMLGLVVATGASGWTLSIVGEDRFEWLEDLHEALADGLIAAAVVHVAGVIWESVRHGENLARAMVTGRKRAPEPGDRE